MKRLLSFIFSRTAIVGASIVIQVVVLLVMILRFNQYFVFFYAICALLSIGAVLWIVNNKSNPGYKIAWIIPILLFPIFGGLFYVIFGGNRLSRHTQKKLSAIRNRTATTLLPDESVIHNLRNDSVQAFNQSHYMQQYAYNPVYQNTYTEYLSPGERKFERLKEELEKAEHFIFLEYFIIEGGVMWDSILSILQRKVKEGVDVRVLYDDVGCLMTLPYRYDLKLEEMGIKCCVFNPFIPVMTARLNNRDHRKIAVIDGHTGFTGGINLADEYINEYEKHGHWKDASIMLKGDAVWSLTVMFLTMWNYVCGGDESFEPYKPHVHLKEPVKGSGYVQPFADNPLDDEAVGETVYLNMINQATQYIYINTPYLILDNEMATALSNAAKQGVDVRIVTPHIADKWYVHAVTRANYEILVENDVRIYEYTPGFIHSKTFAVDDIYGVIGTVNLDYRSLYLHFECGVWLFNNNSILQLKEDFLNTLKKCQEITLEECRKVPWYKKLGRSILRVFAPLM